MLRLKARVSVPIIAVLVLLGAASVAAGAGVISAPRFVDPLYSVGGPHLTSGLAGFPARDYMSRGNAIVRAPFSGCVPTNRPWGRAPLQDPARGFGGSRIYLTQTSSGKTVYIAHLGLNSPYGDLFVRPGECFRQGDPIATVWLWPGDPGRSHPHMGFQGGDPLFTLVRRNNTFVIREGPAWTPERPIFPRALLRKEGQWWRVRVGDKRIYQGGEERARQVYNRQKLARRINLHFRRFTDSPLVGWGLPMVRIARAYDIDPRLEAAIASCETSAGTKGNGPKVNNDFGLLVRGGAHREFANRKAAIKYLSRLLAEKYIAKGRDTIPEIGAQYAPVGAGNDPGGKNSRWVGCVTRYYKALGGTRFLP